MKTWRRLEKADQATKIKTTEMVRNHLNMEKINELAQLFSVKGKNTSYITIRLLLTVSTQ